MGKYKRRALVAVLTLMVGTSSAAASFGSQGVSMTDGGREAVLAESGQVASEAEETVNVAYTKAEKEEIKEAREDMVEDLKGEDIADMSQREVDSLMAEVIEDNYEEVAEDIRDRKEDAGAAETSQVESNMPDKTYSLEEGVSVTFSEDSVALNVMEEGEEMDAEAGSGPLAAVRDLVIEPSYAAVGAKSKICSNATTIYDTLTKKKGFQVFLEVKFTYNKRKKTCTCATLSHYAKKFNFFTALSTVHDAEYIVNKESKGSRTCSQSGYISTGAQYKGNGIVLSDVYACAALSCNYNGTVKKYNKIVK